MSASLFIHPRIHTMADDRPVDGAIAVRDGRIVYVGAVDQARDALGASAEEVRLDGAAVMPVFHDAHIHLGNLARELVAPDLRGASTHAEVVARLRGYARTARVSDWVVGGRWDRNEWGDHGVPHRRTLDDIFGGTPVSMPSVDGHATWANTAALRIAGIDASSPDPAGGRIEREADGTPTGLLLESAAHRVRHIAEKSLDGFLPSLLGVVQEQLIAVGIGHVTDLDGEEVRDALLRMHASERLLLRVHKGVQAVALSTAIAEGRRTGDGDDRFTTGPVKFFADGALGPQTALMHEHFHGHPDNRGIAVTDPEELLAGVRRANEHGLAAATHAIGDRANTNVLDAYERVVPIARAAGLRNRIEHAQHIRPSDLPRLRAHGIIASLQPTHCTSDYPLSVELLGDRDTLHYPWRSLLDGGVALAFGSDAPVEPINPFYGVHAAVTRRTREGEPAGGREPHERLTILEALRAFTLGAAFAAGLERTAGSLEAGKYADFIVLDSDPLTMNPDELWKTAVSTTVISGSIVHHNTLETE